MLLLDVDITINQRVFNLQQDIRRFVAILVSLICCFVLNMNFSIVMVCTEELAVGQSPRSDSPKSPQKNLGVSSFCLILHTNAASFYAASIYIVLCIIYRHVDFIYIYLFISQEVPGEYLVSSKCVFWLMPSGCHLHLFFMTFVTTFVRGCHLKTVQLV